MPRKLRALGYLNYNCFGKLEMMLQLVWNLVLRSLISLTINFELWKGARDKYLSEVVIQPVE